MKISRPSTLIERDGRQVRWDGAWPARNTSLQQLLRVTIRDAYSHACNLDPLQTFNIARREPLSKGRSRSALLRSNLINFTPKGN